MLVAGALLVAGFPPQAASASTTTNCGNASGGLNASQGKCYEVRDATLEIKRNSKGEIVDRKAIAPATAPPQIVRVINRANKIRKKPYSWGGGRGPQWWKKVDKNGYDCSGAVSFAVRGLGAGFLRSPLTSGGFKKWGTKGKGTWLTVYTNDGHAYLEVAGLRFDTSGTGGNGPRWTDVERSARGYEKRHVKGF